MLDLTKISEDLFNKIKGRFPSITIGDNEGKVTTDPSMARFFDFEFSEDGRALGNVSVNLADEKDKGNLTVIYSRDFITKEDQATQSSWYNFLKELRQFAKKRLLNFEVRDINKSNLQKRDYKYLAQRSGESKMTESKLYGTARVSYQKIGEARLVIKHTENINQESATGRTQKIGKIYVESSEGEKFIYPYKHLSGARAMARHVAEGGKPYDDFGKHITSLSEELAKLRKFKNYMGRSAVMAESLAGYMDIVKERILTVKKTVESLQKPAYYKETFETFNPPVLEDVPSDVAENWIDELTIKQFNEELQDIFPYIYKLVSEATRAEEITPENLEEGPLDWAKGKIDQFKKSRAERSKKYDAQLEMMRKIMKDNGMSDHEIMRVEQGCLNDPRVCMYNTIRKKEFGHKFHNELQDVYQELKGGLTTRSGTTDEEIEDAFEDLMGQFSDKVCEDCGNPSWTTLGMTEEEIEEACSSMRKKKKTESEVDEGERHGNSKIYDKCWKGYRKVPGKKAGEKGSCKKVEGITFEDEQDAEEGNAYAKAVRQAKMDGKKKGDKVKGPDGDEITLEKEQKTPLGEFILSYFDRETGQFPKGETAVLTMVEKDYGEEFIEPAKAFIEQINNKVSEVMGYREEPEAPQVDPEFERVKKLAGI
jgi:hypothetical protein